MHQDEGGAGDGPRILAGLVGQHLVEALVPVGTGGGGLEGAVVGRDERAGGVLQLGVGHLVLLDVGVLDVADRVGQAVHESGDAFVALATRAGGPVHGRAFADLALPLGVDLAQVVGEQEAGARTVGAANRGDGGVRQGQRTVQCLDGGIVPLGDLAQVDVAQHLAVELQLARLDAGDVDHGDHAADDGGELHQALGLQFVVLQGRVRRAEIDGLGFDLLQASARTDRLVVDLDAGGLVEIGRPLGVQRCGEAGAGAGHVLCEGGNGEQRGHEAGGCKFERRFHKASLRSKK
ncbi:hypothetical protein D9M68_499720 [compost metagenome]